MLGSTDKIVPATGAPPSAIRGSKAPSGPNRLSYPRLFLALSVAAASDVVSFWTVLLPPVQLGIDLVTAAALYVVLGRRWALLPGLIAEAIPGLGVFPVWVLVVI